MELNVAPHPPAALDDTDRALAAALAGGLPLARRPYAAIGADLGLTEDEVIARTRRLIEVGVIKRFGLVVRHRSLGYVANAMVVWDVPDAEVGAAARRLAAAPDVTLCYRRPRRLPVWPYNLFCMVHGRDRAEVRARIEALARECGLEGVPRALLFSRRCFRQAGACYRPPAASQRHAPLSAMG